MPKYMRVFTTHEAYELWAGGEDYVMPSVAYCTDAKDVHYGPEDPHEFVDLGLPSGVKWATCNLGAEHPEDTGLLYAWGETRGYAPDEVGTVRAFYPENYEWWEGEEYQDPKKGSGAKYYDYDNSHFTKYNELDGKIFLESEDDVVTLTWGERWRMPYPIEVWELMNYTTKTFDTETSCATFTSNINGNSIVIPLKGELDSCDYYDDGQWTLLSMKSLGQRSTNSNDNDYVNYGNMFGYEMWCDTAPACKTSFSNIWERAWGYFIRPVRNIEPQMETVDLGLPSGILWSTCYLGADSSTSAGLYFSWGETMGYGAEDISAGDNKIFAETNYIWFLREDSKAPGSYIKYNDSDGKAVLDSVDDAATVWLGEGWQIPTKDMFDELLDNCTVLDTGSEYYSDLQSNINGNIIRFYYPGRAEFNENQGSNVIYSTDDLCLTKEKPSPFNSDYNYSCSTFGKEEGQWSPAYVSNKVFGYNIRPVKVPPVTYKKHPIWTEESPNQNGFMFAGDYIQIPFSSYIGGEGVETFGDLCDYSTKTAIANIYNQSNNGDSYLSGNLSEPVNTQRPVLIEILEEPYMAKGETKSDKVVIEYREVEWCFHCAESR